MIFDALITALLNDRAVMTEQSGRWYDGKKTDAFHERLTYNVPPTNVHEPQARGEGHGSVSTAVGRVDSRNAS